MFTIRTIRSVVYFTTLLFFNCNESISFQSLPKQVAYIDFEDSNELQNWNLNSFYGHTEIDQVIKFQGASSIHFSPDSGCYVVDRKTGIQVQTGKRYSITLNVIIDKTFSNRTYCVGEFTLILKQGNDEILYQPIFDVPTWEQKTYYFEGKNNLPVNINFLVGNDVWIDNINMINVIDN